MTFNVGNIFNSFSNSNTLILMIASPYTGGLGHVWIIDGGRTVVTNPNSGSAEIFLHCNYGWDAYCDGYYLGAAFDCHPMYTNPNIELGGIRDLELLYDMYYAILRQ
jgi:hypothetical protein